MSKIDHREKSLVTRSEFAKLKKATKAAVYYQIKQGNISTILIGAKKHVFIDLNAHKDFEFDDNAKRR